MKPMPFTPRSIWTSPQTNRTAYHARRQYRAKAAQWGQLMQSMEQANERFDQMMADLWPESVEKAASDNESYVN
jgi:hypothetical protein